MPLWWLCQKHFFLPKCHEQLLTEKGIAWNHLLPSYLEGNFIPWFDLAVLSPMLIALNLDGVVIYLYSSCADPTALGLCCQGLATVKTRGSLHPSPSSLPQYPEEIMALRAGTAPHLICLSYFPMDCCVGRSMEAVPRWGRRAGWAIRDLQDAGNYYCTPGTRCLQAPLHISASLHVGFVLAKGCWHSDVFWRYNREENPEKWQHQALSNASKDLDSQPEPLSLNCIDFHM